MVQFNTRANEILLKLVYYGPGLSGKTTNLQALHAMCRESSRREMFSVNTQEDRTLFFDLLPIELGHIFGNSIHLQIYTVPGQVQYDASRRVVLGGADGVVFVADSNEAAMQDNVDSLSNLYHNLNANRLSIKQIPFVLQLNKRDLPEAVAVGAMNRRLNFRSAPFFEAVAKRGEGVLETFLSITRETVGTIFHKYHLDKKIKDFDELLNTIEASVRTIMKPLVPALEVSARPEAVVLRASASAETPPPGPTQAANLLEEAIQSNMETARLYSELRAAKEAVELKNAELVQAHAQLERANHDNLKTRRYLEGLIQSVGEAIVSFSADGRILTWNAAAEQIFGYARAEIVGRTFQQLTPPARFAELEQAMAQVGRGQVVRDIPTSRLRKDGTEFPASVTYAPIRGGDDQVLACSALIRDLGSQQELEHKVHGLEKAASLGRVLPPLFNDIANRLTPVLLLKSQLLDEALEPQHAGRIGKLLQTLENTQELLRPFLMVLYPLAPQRTACNLNQMVREAARRIEADAAASGVGLDFTLDPVLGETGLDPAMIRDGLVCLLRCCLRQSAGSAAKRIRIGTRQTGSTLQLVCQDTGPALPASEARQVFELGNVKDVDSLGLCVIACVAQAHGGRISVRSQEGLGNAFLVELPMADAQVPNAAVSLQGRRVMVVDDEAFLLECLVDALTAWGCQVTACAQGNEAIQKLQGGSFDGIVSDIRMPGLGGIQLFQWIQTNQPAMAKRILFTTGDSFDPETRAFLQKMQVPSLGKPFDLKKLKDSVTDLLALP